MQNSNGSTGASTPVDDQKAPGVVACPDDPADLDFEEVNSDPPDPPPPPPDFPGGGEDDLPSPGGKAS